MAVALGVLPVLVALPFASRLHQLLTAIAVTVLVWPCVFFDRFARAIALTAAAYLCHSATVIAVSYHSPPACAAIVPGAADYWQNTEQWIRTGESPEYRWRDWLPGHSLLIATTPFAALLTLGLVPYMAGLEQVDLMNYYVGQLMRQSDRPDLMLLYGWHPWSIARGSGFVVLCYVASSWAMQWLLQKPLSTWQRQRLRLLLGLCLVMMDVAIKVTLSPWIRERLLENLHSATI
jgi:hypothetical protein